MEVCNALEGNRTGDTEKVDSIQPVKTGAVFTVHGHGNGIEIRSQPATE
jgi:hypothetical protein